MEITTYAAIMYAVALYDYEDIKSKNNDFMHRKLSINTLIMLAIDFTLMCPNMSVLRKNISK
jgi:hypothetical protein